jgi:1-hydroxycarotenoid 3,4-desaturase
MSLLKTRSALVIGAGIGGLAAAASLCARGIDVTVFERAPSAGGKLRTQEVGGFVIDAGPTVFTMRWVLDELFAEAGTCLDDALTLAPARILARHAWTEGDDVDVLDLPAELDAAVDAIGRFAGAANARGYREFCVRAAAIHDALEKPFLRAGRTGIPGLLWRGGLAGLPGLLRISPFASLWPELARHFSDPRLHQLFGRYATYCGSSPWLAPATLMLVAHVERTGVWRVDGGMQRVAQAIEALATRAGARFRFGTHVEEILERDGRACGVRLSDGEVAHADVVVFNGDVNALATGLLGAPARRALDGQARRWRSDSGRSLSALTWSVAARTAGLPLVRHNVLFSRDYAAEFQALASGRLPDDPTVYVCAQDRGDDESPIDAEAPQRLLCLVNAPAAAGDRHLAEQEIARCEHQAFQRLARCGLRLTPVAPMRRTTPSDFAARFPGTGGALYGPPSHGWRASFQRMGARHAMPGLYLAGGSTHPGPGLPMAALSGRLAAQAVCEDLVSTSSPRPMAMHGGMSTR